MCGFIRKVRHTRGTIAITEAWGLTTPKKLCPWWSWPVYATAALAFAGGGRGGGGGGGGGSAPPSLPNLVLTLLPGWGIVWRGWPWPDSLGVLEVLQQEVIPQARSHWKLNSQSSHLRKLSMNKAKWGFVKTSYGAWRPASCHAFMRFKTMPSQASPDLT